MHKKSSNDNVKLGTGNKSSDKKIVVDEPIDKIFRELMGTPNETKLSKEGSMIEKIVSGSVSYWKALMTYSIENLEKMHPDTNKLLDAVQLYRVREVFYCIDKFQGPLFMLNLKNSKRSKDFFELSYKGGAEMNIDKDIFSAIHRERREELKKIDFFLKDNLEKLKGFYFDELSDEKTNSDILVQKEENDEKILYKINSIITRITQVKKPFYPGLTEHSLTIWQPLESAITILEQYEATTGNNKDFYLAKNLLPNLDLNKKEDILFKPLKVKNTNYIRLPDYEYYESKDQTLSG